MVRLPRTVALTIISLTLILFVVGAAVSVETQNYPWLSTSPSNTGEGGSYWFYRDISRNNNVVLSNPYSIKKTSGRILYMIVGPDKPFTSDEARIIAENVRNGTITLLIADETNNTEAILRELGLNAIGPTIYNQSSKGGGWEWVVKLTCFNETVYTTKAVHVKQLRDGKVLCRYGDGSPAAVLYHVGKGTVVVIGDSSIFANFLYKGDYNLLPPTKNVALKLFSIVANQTDIVLFDSSHYTFTPETKGFYYLSGLAGQISYSLNNLAKKAEAIDKVTLLFIILSASAPWAVIFLFPTQSPPRKKTRLETHEEWLLSVEASRIGVEVEGGGEGIDPVKVARRILKVARRG